MRLAETSLVHQLAPIDETHAGLLPTLILLHGRGANEEDLLSLVPFLSARVLCIAARAPFEFSFGGYTWYELRPSGSPDTGQFMKSYHLLLQFLDDIQKSYPVDPRQTYLLGFSMGAVMAYALSLTKPGRIKGVVAHSGYIPEDTSLQFQWGGLQDTSFFVAHGVNDPVIPVEYGRKAKALLEKTNAPFVYREYPMQHQISEESLRDLNAWLLAHVKSATDVARPS